MRMVSGSVALMAAAMRSARPQAKSSFAEARIIVCCWMLGGQLVAITEL